MMMHRLLLRIDATEPGDYRVSDLTGSMRAGVVCVRMCEDTSRAYACLSVCLLRVQRRNTLCGRRCQRGSASRSIAGTPHNNLHCVRAQSPAAAICRPARSCHMLSRRCTCARIIVASRRMQDVMRCGASGICRPAACQAAPTCLQPARERDGGRHGLQVSECRALQNALQGRLGGAWGAWGKRESSRPTSPWRAIAR